jgi:hypothetical protein
MGTGNLWADRPALILKEKLQDFCRTTSAESESSVPSVQHRCDSVQVQPCSRWKAAMVAKPPISAAGHRCGKYG